MIILEGSCPRNDVAPSGLGFFEENRWRNGFSGLTPRALRSRPCGASRTLCRRILREEIGTMPALAIELRRGLEKVVTEARERAEEAARAGLNRRAADTAGGA